LVEQRKHSSMAPHIVDVHEHDGMAKPSESIVLKFVSGIEVMGELVSRRDVQSKVVRTPMLLIGNEGTS
jgi:hypothetical protein